MELQHAHALQKSTPTYRKHAGRLRDIASVASVASTRAKAIASCKEDRTTFGSCCCGGAGKEGDVTSIVPGAGADRELYGSRNTCKADGSHTKLVRARNIANR